MKPNKTGNLPVTKIKVEPGTSAQKKKPSQSDYSPGVVTSNKSNTFPAVRIKTEPGVAPVPCNTSGIINATQALKIKTEPGLSSSPLHPSRLTSFRPARDLTLSGNLKLEKANKKVFVPNLNVQRNKKKEDGVPVKNDAGPSRGRGRGRGRGQNERGRGRGRGAANVTQSAGVFSEGISEMAHSMRRSGGGGGIRSSGGGSRAQLERPKLNLDVSVDKADEEQKLKLLLRDDFIDDGTDDINADNTPISLPLIKPLKLFKDTSEDDMKTENKVEKKDTEEKPKLENEKIVIPPKCKNIQKEPLSPVSMSVPDIIENDSNGYMVLRFPDCLPGLQSYDDTHDQNNHHRNPIEKKSTDNNAENKNKPDYCTLRSLKAGYLGKLQIHQSGKARLLLGDNSLVVDMGSRLGFRQDVVAAKLDGLNKELVNLGHVTSTIICTPDFESILAKM
ncbi:hypothetical protein PV327_000738 [Microctonus hyperodae]|uniref:DNA-directed RNA polymerase III subunit RPC4 n=1 Tax=Microctonus hyperodae TaxID=165561 RepID=A0AA39L2G5_MICHY|nr:hypothetical protein PV327_000738 [Microctonus hyperodae]